MTQVCAGRVDASLGPAALTTGLLRRRLAFAWTFVHFSFEMFGGAARMDCSGKTSAAKAAPIWGLLRRD
jgi:hypothetical protein